MEFKNGQYQIQGLPISRLAEQFGTPLYVYDGQKIYDQIQTLRQAFRGIKFNVKYACKALTNLSVLKLARYAGAHIDAVSIEEVEIGLKAGYLPQEITFTPNCSLFGEIERAVTLGVMVNIDNLPFLERFGERYQGTIPCGIRINPHIRAGGNSKIQVGHKDSKFGISLLQLDEVERLVQHYRIDVAGLHIHTGSDIKEPEAFLGGAQVLFEAAMRFPRLRFLDFGGGFKVAYREGDASINIHELGAQMSEAFRAFCQRYGRELEMWVEPGKFIVSEAGILLAQATVIKQSPYSQFIGINTGLNHLIRPMMYDAYHQIVNISNPAGQQEQYHVVGYICETDTFGTDRPLAATKEGDILAILNAGAYGFSMSSNYNSRPRPAEVLIWEGKAHLVRKRETLEDILRNQIDMFA